MDGHAVMQDTWGKEEEASHPWDPHAILFFGAPIFFFNNQKNYHNSFAY